MGGMDVPSRLAERERQIIEQVRADLDARKLLAETDEDLIKLYAAAVTEAERLTAAVRKYDPASQEFRRISAARDRAQRNASSLATKLRITTRARASEKPSEQGKPPLLALLRDRLRNVGPQTREERDEIVYQMRAAGPNPDETEDETRMALGFPYCEDVCASGRMECRCE